MKFDCSEPTAKASKGKRLKERMNRKYRNECKMNILNMSVQKHVTFHV